jgi:GMP synthase (glutamine-hydrolysing)
MGGNGKRHLPKRVHCGSLPKTEGRMRVAIVENTKITHHGQMGVALHEAGALIDLYRPYLDGILPARGSYDALVVFGGEQNARDDATHPYLPALADLMAKEAAAGGAVMGICLGSQIMARGAGAQNILGAAPEFGWCEVRLTEGAKDDPLFAALPARFHIFQWHSDTFDLPAHAVHLATSEGAAIQAFRLGPRAYATQFHFEASRNVVADWSATFPELIAGLDPDWAANHPERAKSQGIAADDIGLTLARGWVAMIGR